MNKHLSVLWHRARNSLRGWSLVAVISFLGLLILGIAIYRDYGLGWDEPIQRYIGKSYYNYVVYGNQSLFNMGDRYYGPVYEIFLYTLTNQLPENEMYYARHLIQFLTFFAGTIVFYLLIRRLWGKNWLAWAGWLALVLSPRIFADAFYNSKDIPFMMAFILSAYTLIRLLDHANWKNLLIHAICSAILITVRIPGVLILALTAGFLLLDPILHKQNRIKLYGIRLGMIAGYAVICAGFVYLLWPVLWHNPVQEFITAFQQMSNYPNVIASLYKGFVIDMFPPPSSYIPTWIAISTPIVYLACFFTGMVSGGIGLFGIIYRRSPVEKRNFLIFLTWFFAPILVVIVMRSTLYNAWRQMFFIYPALILIGLQGLLDLYRLVDRLPRLRFAQWILPGLMLIGLIDPVSFMIRNHPYQNVYFNRLAGENLSQVKTLYEMDYWGLSSKAAIDYILKNDPNQWIMVFSDMPTPQYNSVLLPAGQRYRLVFTEDLDQAQYFIGCYHNHPGNYPYSNEVFSVNVDGAKLVSVFKLR